MVRPDWLKARGAVLRRRQDRLRPGAAGPSRLDGRPLQGDAELGICRLLRHRHVPAQRVRRHHPARHHDPGAPRPDGGAGRLGDLVHHRGHRARPAPDGEGLRRHVQPRALRPWPDARSFRRLQEAALPLGLRRHADHEGACRQDAEQHDQAHLLAEVPFRRRLDAVVRRCAEPDLHLGGSRLAAGRAPAAAVRHQAGRPAAGRVHPADHRHLRLQAALFVRPLLRPREAAPSGRASARRWRAWRSPTRWAAR